MNGENREAPGSSTCVGGPSPHGLLPPREEALGPDSEKSAETPGLVLQVLSKGKVNTN